MCVLLTVAGMPGGGAAGSTDLRYAGLDARVVARGLDCPRGLAFGPRGELYVAEAGRGDHESGAVTVVDFGHRWRVLTRLPSTVVAGGVSGPADVLAGDDGELVHVGSDGLHRGRTLVTVGRRPVAVLAVDRGYLVVDAGGDALLRVSARGRVQVVATIPGVSSVAVGPDGAWYAGAGSRIWRVVPGRVRRVWASGFSGITDLAWSPEGRLYVLEAGALSRLSGAGGRETVLVAGLTEPGGLVIRGVDAYLTDCGTCRGAGTILRVRVAGDPTLTPGGRAAVRTTAFLAV
ncbi:MAG TPA: ScyD/ScyE family protein [Actinoplanes sp.]|nr:ScyD/ScyE family protein [Actinoplanes sp.]